MQWLPNTRSDCVTQVSYSHGMLESLEAVHARELLYQLQRQCALHSYALSINIQQSAGGQVDVTVHTLLPVAEVYACIASATVTPLAFTVAVGTVSPLALMRTNPVSQQLRILQTYHGL